MKHLVINTYKIDGKPYAALAGVEIVKVEGNPDQKTIEMLLSATAHVAFVRKGLVEEDNKAVECLSLSQESAAEHLSDDMLHGFMSIGYKMIHDFLFKDTVELEAKLWVEGKTEETLNWDNFEFYKLEAKPIEQKKEASPKRYDSAFSNPGM